MAVLVIDPGEYNPTLSDGIPGMITDNVINGPAGSGNMIRPSSKPRGSGSVKDGVSAPADSPIQEVKGIR